MADQVTTSFPKRPVHRGVPGNERMAALSDGVFAIAITLLVLELHLPTSVPPGGLIQLVPQYLPGLAGHVITFAVLGIYWVGHHNMFMHIRRHDRTLLWLNLLFLLFVAAMPFPTGLIVQHPDDRLAVIVYAGTLVCAGLSLELIWLYATHRRQLVAHDLDPELVTFVHRRVLLAPVIYLVAIAVSFVSITAAKVLFVIVAVAYIVPNPLDYYHHRQFQPAATDKN
jgi:TMEM175 potassium channel family protein